VIYLNNVVFFVSGHNIILLVVDRRREARFIMSVFERSADQSMVAICILEREKTDLDMLTP
jgi:hypothetical protein